MNLDKLSFYASYVAIFCGIFLLVMQLYTKVYSTTNLVMALLFLAVGLFGLRKYRTK